MKFFKFLLQILAMGLCFVAGMVYEKNNLQKTATDIEADVGIEKNIDNSDIITEVPVEQQDIIDEETDFNNNDNMLIDNNIVNIDDTQTQDVNSNQQIQPITEQQVVGQPVNQEQQMIPEQQPIIINSVEPINGNLGDNGNATQSIQNEQISGTTVNEENINKSINKDMNLDANTTETGTVITSPSSIK